MRRITVAAVAATAALALAAGVARADDVAAIGRRLDTLSKDAAELAASIGSGDTAPIEISAGTVARRIEDAKAYFGAGNHDGAALILYEIVDRYPKHPGFDAALYYLAESLFQKGERLVAREAFTRLATELGPRSKYYRQALERLIELTLLLDDRTRVNEWLAALDKVPKDEQRSSVPYIRGKYYYFRGDRDKAIAQFRKVVSTSPYHFQAQYFLGVAQTAKKELDAAAKTFEALLKKKARNDDQRRIHELCHLAIGRLHYERDQPSKAIDSYLNISRHSDLFPEALFEAAWVYVKNKEHDKALHALELLALSDPNSYRMPEVRILEANLRIRRAKKLEESGTGNPLEEYEKARKLFAGTRAAFDDPHAALAKVVAGETDPRAYLEQLTGRATGAFKPQETLPQVAVSWLRQEPEVERIVAVETDLAAVADDIVDAERVIARLEAALDAPMRLDMFPRLAAKRDRGVEIFEKVIALRGRLAAAAGRGARLSGDEKAELARLASARRSLQKSPAELFGAAKTLRDRLRAALDAERRYLGAVARRSPAAARALEQMRKADRVTATLEQMFARIEVLVTGALGDVRRDLEAEKAKLAAFRSELAAFETESAELAVEPLGASFASVADKFYQILVRTDVGAVDVAWAIHEEARGRHRKLVLDQARERRTLEADFAELLRELSPPPDSGGEP